MGTMPSRSHIFLTHEDCMEAWKHTKRQTQSFSYKKKNTAMYFTDRDRRIQFSKSSEILQIKDLLSLPAGRCFDLATTTTNV